MNTTLTPPAHWPANAPNYFSLEGWDYQIAMETKRFKRFSRLMKIDRMIARSLELMKQFKGNDHIKYYKYHDISFRLLKSKIAL